MLVRRVLAAASFMIYAIAVIFSVRAAPTSWQAEYDVSVPAAISHVVYHLPLGMVDSNVKNKFNEVFGAEGVTPASVNKAVEIAARGELPPGSPQSTTDGTGIGQMLFNVAAMRVFGPHLLSLPYLFLLLMGLSTLLFALRYRDQRLIAVPLQFAVLTAMLMIPLMTDPQIRDQVSIGGNRFFVVLGFLPALHMLFEAADAGVAGRKDARWNLIFLCLQAMIFVFVLLVRSAAAYMALPAIIVSLWSIYQSRKEWRRSGRILLGMGIAGGLSIAFATLLVISAPNYLKDRRIGGIFWHRAFISLINHPDWPFGTLRDEYPCSKFVPSGLSVSANDQNGHCVWWTYPPNQSRPVDEVARGIYGPQYEVAVRNALFHVIASYPRQAAEVYLYYKPAMISRALDRALTWQLNLVPQPVLMLGLLQALAFAAFLIYSASKAPFRPFVGAGIVSVIFVLSLTPALVAWATPWTSVDIIFYMYSAIALAIAFAIQSAARAWLGRSSLVTPVNRP